MRALDLTLFYPPQVGGAVTTTLEFIKALNNLGHEVEVLAPSEEETFTGLKLERTDHNYNSGTIVHRVRLPRKFKKWAISFLYPNYVIKKMKNKKFDFLLAHFHFNTGTGWASLIISKILKKPYVLRIHDLYEPETWKQRIFFLLNRVPLKYSAKVLTINEVSRDFLIRKKYVAKEKIHVIPNGVSDIHSIHCKEKINRKKIGFLGSISKDRGLSLILPALIEIKKVIPDIEFHLIGAGEDLDNFKNRLAENKNLKDLVKVHGALKRDVAIEQISQMDLCIGLLEKCNTNEYQLLIKLIEYIHLGIPWVSVTTKGTEEFNKITNSGVIVKEDIDELSQSIINLLTDDQLYLEKVVNGLRSKDMFNWSSISKDLDKVLTHAFTGKTESITNPSVSI